MPGHSDFGILHDFGCILQFFLGASRYCVSCLSCAPSQSGYDIHDFCCRHLRWWSLFCEYCTRSRIIFHNIASEFSTLVLCSITSDLLLTFLRSHAGIFSSFSHSSSTAAFTSGFSMDWGIGRNLCTKFLCCSELSPFPAVWSSWYFGSDSCTRILVLFPISCEHSWGSPSIPCPQGQWIKFLVIFWHYRVSHFCLSFSLAFLPNFTESSDHRWSGLDGTCLFVSLTPDHIYPSGGFSSNRINRVKPVQESDKSLDPSIFQCHRHGVLAQHPSLYV